MPENLLVIRLDNMGDLIMSTPAIRALKDSFSCRMTLLTSAAGAAIAAHIPLFEAVIAWDAPWMPGDPGASIADMAERLKARRFDAAVIFTVCTQNPLPAAMLTFMAGIPVRAAYCRENPYSLLTNWMPDPEPFETIRHQVLRDLSLAASLGASVQNNSLCLEARIPKEEVKAMLAEHGLDTEQPYVVLNCGVSEEKRKYPAKHWAEVAEALVSKFGLQVICTGRQEDAEEAERIAKACGTQGVSLAGNMTVDLLLGLIRDAHLVLTVNSGPAHMAAALETPVLVVYAKTNPQHTPWSGASSVLYFDAPLLAGSRNTAVRFAGRKYFTADMPIATPETIIAEARRLLDQRAMAMAAAITSS